MTRFCFENHPGSTWSHENVLWGGKLLPQTDKGNKTTYSLWVRPWMCPCCTLLRVPGQKAQPWPLHGIDTATGSHREDYRPSWCQSMPPIQGTQSRGLTYDVFCLHWPRAQTRNVFQTWPSRCYLQSFRGSLHRATHPVLLQLRSVSIFQRFIIQP